jgi:hypothetical protein
MDALHSTRENEAGSYRPERFGDQFPKIGAFAASWLEFVLGTIVKMETLTRASTRNEPDMPNPSAFILLDAPTDLSPSKLCEALGARHPDVPIVVPPLDDSENKKVTLLNLAGSIVAIMQFDAPLPDGMAGSRKPGDDTLA